MSLSSLTRATGQLSRLALSSSCRSLSSTADVKLKQTKGPLGKYVYSDPLLMQSALTSEEVMIQQAAREYCQSELMPRIVMANRNEVFDRKIMKVNHNRTCQCRCSSCLFDYLLINSVRSLTLHFFFSLSFSLPPPSLSLLLLLLPPSSLPLSLPSLLSRLLLGNGCPWSPRPHPP